MVEEKEIFRIIERNPGCTPGFFTPAGMRMMPSLIGSDKVIVRYCGMMPHYYTPAQRERIDELALGYETQ